MHLGFTMKVSTMVWVSAPSWCCILLAIARVLLHAELPNFRGCWMETHCCLAYSSLEDVSQVLVCWQWPCGFAHTGFHHPGPNTALSVYVLDLILSPSLKQDVSVYSLVVWEEWHVGSPSLSSSSRGFFSSVTLNEGLWSVTWWS
jgi:hypothetical protein